VAGWAGVMSDPGTIYVLSNTDGSLSKVGMTRAGSPDARADDYSRKHGIQWHVYCRAAPRTSPRSRPPRIAHWQTDDSH
jgi:hypothetical protein